MEKSVGSEEEKTQVKTIKVFKNEVRLEQNGLSNVFGSSEKILSHVLVEPVL